MTLRKRLHTRRGGGGGCVGRGRLRRPRPVPQSPGPSRHGRRKRPLPSSQPPPPLRDDSTSLLVSKKPPCEKPSPAPTNVTIRPQKNYPCKLTPGPARMFQSLAHLLISCAIDLAACIAPAQY